MRRGFVRLALVLVALAVPAALALRFASFAPDPRPSRPQETAPDERTARPDPEHGTRPFHWPWQPTERDLIDRELMSRASYAQSGTALPGTPDLANLDRRLADKQLALGAPIFIRIFKREFELEVWLKRNSRFEHFATYPICSWSGDLGPKLMEGDRQAPEGFYTVDAKAMLPNSKYHRAFNLGFPNVFDRAHNRTGSFLMVHGACGSVGCYAMTNPVIEEIWKLVQASLARGQARFHVHVFPFRMTEQNLATRRDHPWFEFWQTLKPAFDAFESARLPPRISVCNLRYAVAMASPNSIGSEEITSCREPFANRQGLASEK